jgi:hypothetical protein
MSRAGRVSTLMIILAVAVAAGSARAEESTEDGPFHYFTVKPCRLLDTRRGDQGGPLVTDRAVAGGSTADRLFQVRRLCRIPDDARAVALNITVAARNQSFFGHLVAYPANLALPDTSNVNFSPTTAIANFAVVQLGPHVPDLAVHVFLADRDIPSLGGPVELTIDAVGYFK